MWTVLVNTDHHFSSITCVTRNYTGVLCGRAVHTYPCVDLHQLPKVIPVSGLSDYLNSLNTDGWSLRRIAQEAERHGHQINHTTVRKYINGTHGTPSAEALAALAAAFRVGVNDMRAAADRPSVGEPLDLGPESGRLTGPQREAVRHVVRVMLEQNDALADRPVRDGAMSGPSLTLVTDDAPELEGLPYAADEERPGDDPGEDND